MSHQNVFKGDDASIALGMHKNRRITTEERQRLIERNRAIDEKDFPSLKDKKGGEDEMGDNISVDSPTYTVNHNYPPDPPAKVLPQVPDIKQGLGTLAKTGIYAGVLASGGLLAAGGSWLLDKGNSKPDTPVVKPVTGTDANDITEIGLE